MYAGALLTTRSTGLLRSLNSIKRIEMLDALRVGPKNVGQLVACQRGCQSGVSRDLRVLYGSGLVSREAKGCRVVYSISPTVRQLCLELDAVAQCVLKRQRENNGRRRGTV